MTLYAHSVVSLLKVHKACVQFPGLRPAGCGAPLPHFPAGFPVVIEDDGVQHTSQHSFPCTTSMFLWRVQLGTRRRLGTYAWNRRSNAADIIRDKGVGPQQVCLAQKPMHVTHGPAAA